MAYRSPTVLIVFEPHNQAPGTVGEIHGAPCGFAVARSTKQYIEKARELAERYPENYPIVEMHETESEGLHVGIGAIAGLKTTIAIYDREQEGS